MGKIVIHDAAKLRDAIQFAEKADCLDRFGRDLCRLIAVLAGGMTAGDGSDAVAELYPDRGAPHSFEFAIWRDAPFEYSRRDGFQMNGGWIYAGPGAPGDGSGPSFSVNLDWVTGNAPKHSWSVHT